MIEYYELRKVNKEQVLILYLSFDYEFASFDKNSLLNKINHFVKVNKLKWKGNKVVLVVGGLVLGSIVLGRISIPSYQNDSNFHYVSQVILNHYDDDNNQIGYSQIKIEDPIVIEEQPPKIKSNSSNQSNNNSSINNNSTTYNNSNTNESIFKEEPSNNESENNVPSNSNENSNSATSNNQNDTSQEESKEITVMVTRNSGLVELSLEDYVIGVVGAEMPASFNIEALKAQAIAARTYALKYLEENRSLTDDVSTQSYKDNEQLKAVWGSGYDTYYNKIKQAVEDTSGMVITYQGEYIEALYHSTSNGYTESSYEVFGKNYPYLVTVSSIWDMNASSYLRETSFTFEELSQKLGIDFNQNTFVEILDKNLSGRVTSLRVADNYYSGIEFRNLLGLRSADFDIDVGTNNVIITTRGYGHGVGMSQYGANGMANNGKTYIQILAHYYPSTTIQQIEK